MNIGQRVTPATAAKLHRKTRGDHLAMDSMDSMATTQGWAVSRATNDSGKPRSVYARGNCTLVVQWNHAGHGLSGDLYYGADPAPVDRCKPPAGLQGRWPDAVARSQAVFRWVGHKVYDGALR